MILLSLLWLGCLGKSFGQSEEMVYPLVTKESAVVDFLFDEGNKDAVFWGYYDWREKRLRPTAGGYVYTRDILKDIKIERTTGVINVVVMDNTILYDDDTGSRLEAWHAISIDGKKYLFPEKDNQYKASLASIVKQEGMQAFLAENRRTRREYAERMKFKQLYDVLAQSRSTRFRGKQLYKAGVYKVEEEGRWGMVDDDNNIMIPLQYTEAEAEAVYDREFGEQPGLDVFIVRYLEENLPEWERKDEFETAEDYALRTERPSAKAYALSLLSFQGCVTYEKMYGNIMESFALEDYDAGNETFLVRSPLGDIPVKVPREYSPLFKEQWAAGKVRWSFLSLKETPEGLSLGQLNFVLQNPANPNETATLEGSDALAYQSYSGTGGKRVHLQLTRQERGREEGPVFAGMADVDVNIPEGIIGEGEAGAGERTFAVVIANEDYRREARVPFAVRDGEVFAEYCRRTLGIPEKQVRVVKNATLNELRFELDWLRQALEAEGGRGRAIVYYAGHGIPDEGEGAAYLLPTDGYGSNPATGMALSDLYGTLAACPAERVTVFLDACFSGAKRESGMMNAARGVAIKVRKEAPRGNVVVFAAAQGDETAYQYAEKGHGMFTYFLLKKLQESRGAVTLGELGDYLAREVGKASLLNNDKRQTPTVIPAAGMAGWQELELN